MFGRELATATGSLRQENRDGNWELATSWSAIFGRLLVSDFRTFVGQRFSDVCWSAIFGRFVGQRFSDVLLVSDFLSNVRDSQVNLKACHT